MNDNSITCQTCFRFDFDRTFAIARGWQKDRDGKDICPVCANTPPTTKTETFPAWRDPQQPPPPTQQNGDSDSVLICTESWGIFVGWYEADCRQWWSSAANMPLRQVTGWMPLPEPAQSDAVKRTAKIRRGK